MTLAPMRPRVIMIMRMKPRLAPQTAQAPTPTKSNRSKKFILPSPFWTPEEQGVRCVEFDHRRIRSAKDARNPAPYRTVGAGLTFWEPADWRTAPAGGTLQAAAGAP